MNARVKAENISKLATQKEIRNLVEKMGLSEPDWATWAGWSHKVSKFN